MNKKILLPVKRYLGKHKLHVLAVLVLILAGTSAYFYNQSVTRGNNPDYEAQAEARDLSREVGKIALVPSEEEPSVATVSDLFALAGQPFFADAKVGDKVLIYAQAKKAVLYDPKARKIVNIAPLNLGDSSR